MKLVIAALAAPLLLGGCAPDYNWRELRASEQGYVVMLPGKPATMTRSIHLEDLEVSMTMHGARVGDTSFTVAEATLPEDSESMRAKAVAAMHAGMLRNIAGVEQRSEPIRIDVVDAGGKTVGAAPALRIEARGRAQGQPVAMQAGFSALGRHAYQWVVIGRTVDPEQAATFLASFRLTAAP